MKYAFTPTQITSPLRGLPGKISPSWMVLAAGVFGALLGGLTLLGAGWLALALAVAPLFGLFFLKHPLVALLTWLLLLPFIAVLPAPDQTWWLLHRLLIPGAFGVALLRRWTDENAAPLPPPGLPLLSMLILCGMAAISLSFHPDAWTGARHFADRLLIPVLIFALLRYAPPQPRDLDTLRWLAVFVVVTQTLVGVTSWVAPSVLPFAWRFMEGHRTIGTFRDPAVFTSYLVFSMLLLFHWAMELRTSLGRSLLIAVCVLALVGVFLSMERGSWLGAVLAVSGLFVLYPGAGRRMIMIGAALAAVIVVVYLSTQLQQATVRLGEKQQIYDRLVVSDAMLRMTTLKPVVGWGYDTLDYYIVPFYRSWGAVRMRRAECTSHNTYLTFLTEMGVIGFAISLIPPAALLWQSWKNRKLLPEDGRDNRLLLAVLWLALGHTFTVSNFIDMRFFPQGIGLWYLILGLIAAILQRVPAVAHAEPDSPVHPTQMHS